MRFPKNFPKFPFLYYSESYLSSTYTLYYSVTNGIYNIANRFYIRWVGIYLFLNGLMDVKNQMESVLVYERICENDECKLKKIINGCMPC